MKMLCCCRRRGTYMTTPVEPSSIKPRTENKARVKIPVPVHIPQVQQDRQESLSVPKSPNIPPDNQLLKRKSDDKTVSRQEENRESLKNTHNDDVNHSNSVEKTKPSQKEDRESIKRTQEETNQENSVDETILRQKENTQSVSNTREEPEIIASGKSTQKENSQSIKAQNVIAHNEEDMKKISIDVDISDIKGPVPLNTPRRSRMLSNITVSEIEEEQEDVEIRNANKQKQSESNHQSKVKFGKVEYSPEEEEEEEEEKEKPSEIVQERREGVREAINVDKKTEITKYPKSVEEIENLKEALASNEFLHAVLKGETLNLVIEAMHERLVSESEVITQEGEPGRNMYVSESGEYEIYVKKKLFNTFDDQRVFGELAILYDTKRKATIRAVTDGKVWVLQRDVYQQILVQCAIKDFEENLEFLKMVPLVNTLDEESLKKIAHLLRKEFFKTDTHIIREGDPGDKFYIIRAGTVTVTKEGEGEVAEMVRGQFFGERALLQNFNRQASVIANTPGVECLTLMRSDFNDHFDEKILNPDLNESGNDVSNTGEQIDNLHLSTENYEDVDLKDLEKKAVLGVGGFGRVELVRHKNDENLTFALKILKKSDVMQKEQIEHVLNEKEVQMNCYSMFIVRLYKTFKDEKYLYFLLESCLGGDLWNYLQKQKNRQISETDAHFYTACVLEGLAYLHERNYVYRDLKPENMLFSSNGYLKLADFGFAKKLNTGDKTYTFNGTLEYLAPEIITNNGHDKAVDYWALGIFIFELLAGHAPFQTGDLSSMQAFNSILRGIKSIQFPKQISRNATNLIHKLCKSVPTERLGNLKNGAQDIRNHRWFRGFDWFALRRKQIKPPYVPRLESNIDTKYFGIFEEDDEDPPNEFENFGDF